jgi:hypothetical protein
MSPGARFLVEVADGWRVRSVEFEADDQGNIERRYFADGIRRPFDAEAQRFWRKCYRRGSASRGTMFPNGSPA